MKTTTNHGSSLSLETPKSQRCDDCGAILPIVRCSMSCKACCDARSGFYEESLKPAIRWNVNKNARRTSDLIYGFRAGFCSGAMTSRRLFR